MLRFLLRLVVVWLLWPCMIWAEPADMESQEVKVYKTFADHFIQGRLDAARALAGSETLHTILNRKEKALAKAGGPRAIDETIFMIIDQRKLAGGATKIHGMQIIQYQEPANDPPVFHRQFVTVRQQEGGWRVEEFMDEEEECCK
ncbi:MAG: hypothetical protein G8345_15320 [Magnetococcales bacterium]|nr:hypothetical protein [Magnetococcales bacterium]NGZ28248.1 hypothetical protein [Magnetococcales bacterium]